MITSLKPMLAASLLKGAVDTLEYPLYASPKLDGVRALVTGEGFVSRNLKPIPNQFVQSFASEFAPLLDGELVVGDPTEKDCFRKTTSGVMSAEGTPNFTFWVFDRILELEFRNRLADVKWRTKTMTGAAARRVAVVPHKLVQNAFELHEFEEAMLERGFEGVMLRSPDSPYKHGRSTLREGYLIKMKRFVDSEAVVIGCEELLHNQNTATTNALGHKERSAHKAGKVRGGTLGALFVRDCATGVEFRIGSGFTAEERQLMWHDRGRLTGQIVRYRYFPTGSKTAPRFPVFAGWRSPDDL